MYLDSFINSPEGLITVPVAAALMPCGDRSEKQFQWKIAVVAAASLLCPPNLVSASSVQRGDSCLW